MPASKTRPFKFKAQDRIWIDGATYRAVSKDNRSHILQLVTDEIVEKNYISKTDDEIAALIRSRKFRHEPDFFAKSAAKLRARFDDTSLDDCTEEDLRDIRWKKEWCERFNRARLNTNDPERPTLSLKSIERFIEREKGALDRWYFRQYQVRRKPGRVQRTTGKRKEFDYPSPSTLRNWLLRYRHLDERAEAFKLNYRRCGNRDQLDPEVRTIVEKRAREYAASNKPKMCDIYDFVCSDLILLNEKRSNDRELKVSYKTVRRHIHKIAPFIVEAGRNGVERAKYKYAAVGTGVTAERPLQRVEIDDWTADLFTLLEGTTTWRSMTPAQQKAVERKRCTVTVAIDCATRCVVGLNVTPGAPSTAGSKTALRRVFADKKELKDWAGTVSDWDMHGRPEKVVSDNGPAFKGDFEVSLPRLGIDHDKPEEDARKRGTIESFFRQLKKLCRLYSGQSFANIVEKGDYPAEDMASLTYEEFYKAVIVYIVDHYHNRKHRGLNWRTPAQEWNRLVQKHGLAPTFSDEAIAAGIGLRFTAKLSKHGVLFSNISYGNDELSALHRRMDDTEVSIVVDQTDLGQVLVRVPNEFLEFVETPGGGSFLPVKALEQGFSGTTLVDFLAAQKLLRQSIEANRKKFDDIRIQSFAKLLAHSEEARRAAKLHDEVFTQEQADKLEKELNRLNTAAFDGPNYSDQPTADHENDGISVATPEKSRPTSHYGDGGVSIEAENDVYGEFGEDIDSLGEDDE